MTSRSCYERLETIGQGTYGRVYKVRRLEDGAVLVMKDIPFAALSQREQEETLNEVKVMSQVDHPAFIRYETSFMEDGILHIVMEHASGGDIGMLLDRQRVEEEPIPEHVLWSFLVQISQGLHHLHANRILHRDLKPQNIFLDKDNKIKIGDFGLGRIMGSHSAHARSGVGTPLYFSPELCQDLPYDEKSDIWALGCLFYEMAVFEPPFIASNQIALAKKIVNTEPKEIPESFTTEFRFLVMKMLEKNPLRRPSTQQILNYSPVRRLIHEAKLHRLEAKLARKYTKMEEQCQRKVDDVVALLEKKETEIDALKRQVETLLEEKEQQAQATQCKMKEMETEILKTRNQCELFETKYLIEKEQREAEQQRQQQQRQQQQQRRRQQQQQQQQRRRQQQQQQQQQQQKEKKKVETVLHINSKINRSENNNPMMATLSPVPHASPLTSQYLNDADMPFPFTPPRVAHNEAKSKTLQFTADPESIGDSNDEEGDDGDGDGFEWLQDERILSKRSTSSSSSSSGWDPSVPFVMVPPSSEFIVLFQTSEETMPDLKYMKIRCQSTNNHKHKMEEEDRFISVPQPIRVQSQPATANDDWNYFMCDVGIHRTGNQSVSKFWLSFDDETLGLRQCVAVAYHRSVLDALSTPTKSSSQTMHTRRKAKSEKKLRHHHPISLLGSHQQHEHEHIRTPQAPKQNKNKSKKNTPSTMPVHKSKQHRQVLMDLFSTKSIRKAFTTDIGPPSRTANIEHREDQQNTGSNQPPQAKNNVGTPSKHWPLDTHQLQRLMLEITDHST